MPQYNLIITCGTSQINPDKKSLWSGIDASLTIEFFRDLKRRDNRPNPQAFYQNHNKLAGRLLTTLLNRKEELSNSTLSDSPFGAEISTLYKLKELGKPTENGNSTNWRGWTPEKDTCYTILSSDTPDGYFCAQILYGLLVNQGFWQIPPEKVKPVSDQTVIFGLKPDAANAKQTETGLANLIQRVHEHKQQEEQCRNVIVASGGFKSILPYLSLFALLHCWEMVYLFEDSPVIQPFFSPRSGLTSKERKEWKAACKKLVDLNGKESLNISSNTPLDLIWYGPVSPEKPVG